MDGLAGNDAVGGFWMLAETSWQVNHDVVLFNTAGSHFRNATACKATPSMKALGGVCVQFDSPHSPCSCYSIHLLERRRRAVAGFGEAVAQGGSSSAGRRAQLAGKHRTHAARGLAFRVDEAYRAQLQTAGADDAVLAAVNKAKLGSDPGPADKWELELLGHLTSASASLNQKKYTDAGAELTAALKSSVRSPEAGFVMGAILREQEEFEAAAEVYTEVLREDPGFPDAHTKLSFILYKLKDSDSCLREAKLALSENPQNPEAHKNMGLGYLLAGKFDASLNEDKEALRLKPDYAVVHGNMGIVYDNQHDYDNAIVEYKKATVAFPDNVNYHYNLGTMEAAEK